MNPIYIWISLLSWMLIAIVIAYMAKRGLGEGAIEYFLGGRRLGGFISGLSYSATTYSAFMLVGLVGLTYKTGVGALGFEMTYLLFTVLLLSVFAPRFWLAGNKYGFLTPAELLSQRYETHWAGVVSAVIFLVMLVPYAAVQLMGLGFLVEGLTGGDIPYMAGVGVMAGFACFAALWAGMRSVSWTDAFQAITMLTTSLFALFYLFFHFFGSPGNFFRTITLENPELLELSWDPRLFIGLALPWAFFALTNPQVSQRMLVPDKLSSLKRMIIYFAAFGFVYTIISTLFGFQAAHLLPGLTNADKAMPKLLTIIPLPVGLIIFIGIFAAATSTLGSITLTLSSSVSRDIVGNLYPDAEERIQLLAGKLAIPLLIGVFILFAWLRPGLIAVLSSMASGGLLVTAPPLIGAFFWKRGTGAGVVSSMSIGGVATGVLYLANFKPFGWWPSVWGFLLTIFLFVTVSLFTSPPEKSDEFVDFVNRRLKEVSES
ncbi:sodium:solute symporter family protein [Candidatus Bipolaricaulota bacterium]|nr:sodium:solute symporter family protein [Candidatus Bipolaricaulota bacterium]MBS3825526.1 sodium:solute symporter family protein [Candidatus Bipolaricaulota bacterium]